MNQNNSFVVSDDYTINLKSYSETTLIEFKLGNSELRTVELGYYKTSSSVLETTDQKN